MECKLSAIDASSQWPGRPVRTLVGRPTDRCPWCGRLMLRALIVFTKKPQVQIRWPLGGQALSPHNDKSVRIVRCNVCLLGWVRINPKYGVMRPGSHCRESERRESAMLRKHLESELKSGAVVQVFDSGPTEICSNLRLCPGDVFSYMYQATLPPELPPSFLGRCFSIVYAVAAEVVLEGVGNIVPLPRTVHLPLTVSSPVKDPEFLHSIPLYGTPGPGGSLRWHDFAARALHLHTHQPNHTHQPRAASPSRRPHGAGGDGGEQGSTGARDGDGAGSAERGLAAALAGMLPLTAPPPLPAPGCAIDPVGFKEIRVSR